MQLQIAQFKLFFSFSHGFFKEPTTELTKLSATETGPKLQIYRENTSS